VSDGRRSRLIGWAIVIVWVALCVWIAQSLRDQWSPRGDLDGLIPQEHRASDTEVLVMLRRDPNARGADTATVDDLLATADRIHEHLGPVWVPIAPPAVEVEGWLDTHALLFLPLSSHTELRNRLTDDSMSAAVAGLRARLSSPLFGLTGEEPRRDPLDLRELTATAAGQFGHVRAGTPAGASVTPNGDLLARSRDALLMQLHLPQATAVDDVLQQVTDVVGEGPWTVDLVGPQRTERDAAQALQERAGKLTAITLAAIGLVLALALRRVRAALAILVTLTGSVALVAAFLPSIDPISFPLLVLLAGFGCEGSFHMQRISARGWPAAGVLGTALLPLLLSPYPEWRDWAWWWLAAIVFVMLMLRLVLPAIMAVIGGKATWDERGFLLRTSPAGALLLTAGILGAGAWATETIELEGPNQIELGAAVHPAAQTALVEKFYDPKLVAETDVEGADPTAALVAAAERAKAFESLVPQQIVRVDSPGSMVLQPDEVQRRRASLAQLDLPARLAKLETMLQNQGFRPAAFGESLRNALDEDSSPSPEALVDGPLGRWVRRYLVESDDGVVVRTFLHLPPNPSAPIPLVVTDEGEPIELLGPVVAARRDRGDFKDWLAVYLLCQLWLGSFVVWVGTRSFATALSAAVASIVTQTAVLSALVFLGQPLGPLVVPVLMLVGAGAMVAAGRACRAVDMSRPFFAMGVLTTSACQVAAGLALVAADVPAWTQVGIVAAVGAAVGSGIGLFVAPGLTRMFRAIGGVRVVVHHEEDEKA
jgi:hypothetical protein